MQSQKTQTTTDANKTNNVVMQIAQALAPLIEESEKRIMARQDEHLKMILERITAESAEIMLKCLAVQNSPHIEKTMVESVKKPAARAAKVAAPAKEKPEKVEKFPVNFLVYFRRQCSTDEEYRNKYITEELLELMVESDHKIPARASENQIILAKANFCMAYYKKNNPNVLAEIKSDFEAAKHAHDGKSKQPQECVEERSPEKK